MTLNFEKRENYEELSIQRVERIYSSTHNIEHADRQVEVKRLTIVYRVLGSSGEWEYREALITLMGDEYNDRSSLNIKRVRSGKEIDKKYDEGFARHHAKLHFPTFSSGCQFDHGESRDDDPSK